MHPILVEIFQRPVGWLVFGGTLLMVALPFVIRAFINKQIAKEDAEKR